MHLVFRMFDYKMFSNFAFFFLLGVVVAVAAAVW